MRAASAYGTAYGYQCFDCGKRFQKPQQNTIGNGTYWKSCPLCQSESIRDLDKLAMEEKQDRLAEIQSGGQV